MSAWDRARAFVDRFKNELGYRSVMPWAIYGSEGEAGRRRRLMYHMIHATDHPEAPKQMARAYEAATIAPAAGQQLTFI